MERVKKNDAALTLKEKLDQALVPDWEWPYKVPENWCWVRLGVLISSSKVTTANFSTDMKYVGLEHIEKDSGKIEYGSAESVKSQKNRFCAGQILYGKLRPYLNKHGIPTFDGVCSTDILVFDAQKISIAEYINFFFDTRDFLEYSISNSRGVNLPRVSETTILEAKCPLAPLPEQQRIVNRIESLFAKLDEAKEKAQATLDSFETRQAIILHKAFTGELTAKWRAEHGIELASWTTDDIVNRFDVVGGIQKSPMRTPKNNPIPYLTVANVFRNRLDLTEIRYFEVFEGELDKLKLENKDILVVEGNGSGNEIGRCAIWNNELPVCIHQNHIIRLRSKDRNTLPEYVLYYLNSNSGKQIMRERAKTTAGLFNLSTGKIKTIPIPFAKYEEQKEIVRLLDRISAEEWQAKESAEAVLEQIDLMKKAILSRAFRGELGTNDPTEESAIGLLKKYLL